MNPSVRTAVDDGVLTITLDRPKANAIDVATSLALHAAFVRLQQEPALRVAIITGTGRFFSAGWDLSAAVAGEAIDADHGPGGFAGLTEFFTLDKPVIAAVNGLAIGGGFELALAADLIVAADSAEFALPEVKLGLLPGAGGTQRLPRAIGLERALNMILSGETVSASEFRGTALLDDLTEGDVVDAAVAPAPPSPPAAQRWKPAGRRSRMAPLRHPTPVNGCICEGRTTVRNRDAWERGEIISEEHTTNPTIG